MLVGVVIISVKVALCNKTLQENPQLLYQSMKECLFY